MASNHENLVALHNALAAHKLRKQMKQETKFKVGDQVRVVNYGHLLTYGKKGYQKMREHFEDNPGPSFWDILMGNETKCITPPPKEHHETYKPAHLVHETEEEYFADMSPEIVGQTGIVVKAQVTQGISGYAIDGPSKHAWYNDSQLELIHRHPKA